jgi:hypothetical protein
MNANPELLEALADVPAAERDFLFKLAESDTEEFLKFLKRYFKVRFAIRTGNRALWNKVQNEQAEELESFRKELESAAAELTLSKIKQ